MLLFISMQGNHPAQKSNFNTSHVTVYPISSYHFFGWHSHFNTSHVTVYHRRNVIPVHVGLISIHLMLLFIGINSTFETKKSYISIHLMLLFITVWMYHPCSRCSISIHLMLLFICNQNCDSRCGWLFQYISCYCLSKIQGASIKYCYGFQYISCYCLSYPVHCLHHSLPHFNTSHVTVYHLRLHL